MKILNKGIVGRNEGSIFPYQAWPTVAKDENGVLYVVASGHRLGHVCPFGKNIMYKSYDNGNTWTSPMIINDTCLDDRDAGITYLGNGKILVSFFKHPASVYETQEFKEYIERFVPKNYQQMAFCAIDQYKTYTEEQKAGGSYVILSEDYGNTWSKPIKLPISAPHGPTLAKDGSLLYVGNEMYSCGEISKETTWFYKSLDCGKTWNKVSAISNPDWLNENELLVEPHVIEIEKDFLLSAFRIEGRFGIGTSISKDGGKTWEKVVDTGIKGSPPHLYKSSNGMILMSYGKRVDAKEERVAISCDNGKTWEKDFLLNSAENPDMGYTSTIELDNGEFLSVYYDRYIDDSFTSILYTKWKIEK